MWDGRSLPLGDMEVSVGPEHSAPESPHSVSVAVIGSGIAGLTASYILSRQHRVTLFEADTRLGGHTHTHQLGVDQGNARVDSGFIVHNDRTYPLLLRLFSELGIQTRDTEMSMSIHEEATGLEYAGGRGVMGFLGRPQQLLRRDYRSMLWEVRRFHRLARQFLHKTTVEEQTTFGEFIEHHQFTPAFVRLYAVPVVACVWSSGQATALEYPARYLFEFLQHHGMLQIGDSPTWRTVVNGSATYIDAIVQKLAEVRQGTPVIGVTRQRLGVTLRDHEGRSQRFDKVVIATHADQALHLLDDATPLEKDILGAFRYSTNPTVLHQDARLMPRSKAICAAWNYRVTTPPHGSGGESPPVVTYWMNRLQGLDQRHQLFVTLNATERIDPQLVLAEMNYQHPVYDLPAVQAQHRLPELNTHQVAFAGAYHGWGFHEDGARAGVAAARSLGVTW
jgi:uncharacterized protein